MGTLKQLGVFLFTAGIILICAWVGYAMMLSSDAPLAIRLGTVVIILGTLFVLISLILERSKEEEKDVDRKY